MAKKAVGRCYLVLRFLNNALYLAEHSAHTHKKVLVKMLTESKARMTKALGILALAISPQVHTSLLKAGSCNSDERDFQLELPPSLTVCSRPYPTPPPWAILIFTSVLIVSQDPAAGTGSHPVHPGAKPVDSSHSCWFPPPSSLFSSPRFLTHFSLLYLPHNLAFGSAVPTNKDSKGKGRKWA